ncbi:magnesium transporter [Halopseudomonas litoralis]|uniref:Magnesium transporter MgtE n=1 Tax=Halopseudomonas litoralis TaxID=797277 RepID=A0A1H1UWG1_9GAMM|nr:magnesium transporter [Halopseudomonas litoralis]SDS76169.1 magnesium transporter [Halopseudomonas litoralis]
MSEEALSVTETRESVVDSLAKGKFKRVRRILRELTATEVVELLNQLDPEQQQLVWNQIGDEEEQGILTELDPALAERLLTNSDDHPDTLEPEAEDDEDVSPITQVREALEAGRFKRALKILGKLHPSQAAGLLEALPPAERSSIWSRLDSARAGQILVHLREEVRASLALEMSDSELLDAAHQLDLDDLVDLIQALPFGPGRQLLLSMDVKTRQQLADMLSYPEESAGGLMNIDHISVRADVRVSSILRYLRLLEDLPDHTDKLMVVDRENRYLGVLRLSRLVTSPADGLVSDVMDGDFKALDVLMSSQEVQRQFEDLDMLSAAVTSPDGILLGRITVDDVMDSIREDSERAIMGMAGLDDEADMFAPVLTSTRRRSVWLGCNLITAFLAASVIGQFQGALEQIVALAVLMPVVASMGGIAGSQTLTLVIRGLALGQVDTGNLKVLLVKELGIGTLNGLLWAVLVAVVAFLWFGSLGIGWVIGLAILINLVCAVLAGLLIPLILRRFGIDPALAGSMVLMAVTDVVGFSSFLGLATVFLL